MTIISVLNRLDRRFRLLIALGIAGVILAATAHHRPPSITFMLTWIGFAGSSLAFSWITILSVHPKDIGVVASQQDSSQLTIFLFVVTAAFISLFAIILLLHGVPSISKRGLSYHILLSAASVACSWLLIHTLFTLRYAHLYYCSPTQADKAKGIYAKGLLFPDSEQPDFLDFAYFSFVLGMTFQVSDVQIASSSIRRLALIHGFLSFIYNTIIVALSINIISGIIER